MLAWFDWQIKGIDNGYADLPRVRYWLGRGRALGIGGRLAGARHGAGPAPPARRPIPIRWPRRRSSAAPPAEPSAQSFLAIPSTSYYVREIDRYEAQVLRYQTAPMADDTAYIGPVHLRLTLTSTALDTYLMARLSDVAPDGTRRKLAFGWLLASHRRIDPERSNPSEIIHDHRIEAVEALRPGSPTELSFSLTPISHLFRRGHRLLLEIGARPELLCTEKGEGFDSSFGTRSRPRPQHAAPRRRDRLPARLATPPGVLTRGRPEPASIDPNCRAGLCLARASPSPSDRSRPARGDLWPRQARCVRVRPARPGKSALPNS